MAAPSFIDSYTELKKIRPLSVRNHVRNLVLEFLSLRISENDELFKKPRIQFLYIHHIFKDEEKSLIRLIETLGRNHRFISYSDALKKILTRQISEPAIVFSSDDGLKNNLSAARIFSSYNISACFFVNPSIIGESRNKMIEEFCRERLHFPPVEFMGWEEIHQLQQMGHEIGSHTMSHINVAQTPANQLKDEIYRSYLILNERCGGVHHFAYPYGRFFHFSEEGRRMVFDAGFESCCSAERGCHVNHSKSINREDLLIRRDHVILDWKLKHILYFLAVNANKAGDRNNLYPWLCE